MLRVFCNIKKGKPFELSLSVLLLGIYKNLPFSLLWRRFKGEAKKKNRFLEVPY